MNLYPTTITDALEQVEECQEWLDIIQEKFIKKEIDYSKVKISYQWGFFVERKGVDKEIFYDELYKRYETLKYPERLEEELAKIRVSIAIEYKKFGMINRISSMPKDIEIIITEITKIKMLAESKGHGNQDVIDSIPKIDPEIIGYDEILFDDFDDSMLEYDVDDILDKISELGIESLSDDERLFLKNLGDED